MNSNTHGDNLELLIHKLNDPEVQNRILSKARTAVLEQIRIEGIDLTPEMLAQLATSNATRGDGDAAAILASGAVFIATICLFSDVRLKSNVVRVGKSKSGINIYDFSYEGHSTRWRGVIAQELQQTHPNAVFHDKSGYLVVNYDNIDVDFRKSS